MARIFLVLLLTTFGQTIFAQNNDKAVDELIEQAQQAEQNNDFTTAFDLYEKASKQKDGFAKYKLAWLYERGLGTNRNLRKAEKYYKRSAKAGDPNGLYEMGNWLFYYDPQFYVETKKRSHKNIEKALDYYQKAKAGGNEEAGAMIDIIKELKRGETEKLRDLLYEMFQGQGVNKDSIVLQQNLLNSDTESEHYMYNWKLHSISSSVEELIITLVCWDEECALIDNRTIYLPFKGLIISDHRSVSLFSGTRYDPVLKCFSEYYLPVEDYQRSDFNGEEMNMITESDMTAEELEEMKLFNSDFPYHKLIRINRIFRLMESEDLLQMDE